MILSRSELTILLNALYETDKRAVTVKHPAAEIGELLRFELEDAFASPVRFTTRLSAYTDAREEVKLVHGEPAYDDLPDDSAYVRALVAGGVLDINNRDDIDRFIHRHGYRDLESGHAPAVAGIDANVMPWRPGDVLGFDATTGARKDGRAPTNGYALATGVKSELDWHYKQYNTASLVEAFGEAFERTDGQPAGANREGFLGLYEFRRLVATRNVDLVECEPGDEAIVDGYRRYNAESRKDVLLFSNDFGFIDRAGEAGLPAQHIDFARTLPRRTTTSWDSFADLLYYLAVTFAVIELPGVTLFGVWNGKNGSHWQNEQVVVSPRSPKVESRLERDKQILDAPEK